MYKMGMIGLLLASLWACDSEQQSKQESRKILLPFVIR